MRNIAVLGLGYVGLPVAVAFAEHFPGTVGFDIDTRRVAALRGGEDWTGEIGGNRLQASGLAVTSELSRLKACDTFIVCVPTPIHKDRRPNLEPLRAASESVGQMMRKGALVIYESTVYPGVTEEYCGPILARVSGLKQGRDFKLGYSPERINPGDKEHSFERILKVTDRRSGGGTLWHRGHGRHSSRLFHQGGRSGQGAGKHPARPQYRADERDGDHLRRDEDSHPRCHRGGGDQMEFSQILARPGGRPLHRRGSLLPDLQGAGTGL
jgi:hypothetical protein